MFFYTLLYFYICSSVDQKKKVAQTPRYLPIMTKITPNVLQLYFYSQPWLYRLSKFSSHLYTSQE
jgi:hypothetical protein